MGEAKSLRMKNWLILTIGSWRVRREGRDAAEQSHPFWDRIVGWIA